MNSLNEMAVPRMLFSSVVLPRLHAEQDHHFFTLDVYSYFTPCSKPGEGKGGLCKWSKNLVCIPRDHMVETQIVL